MQENDCSAALRQLYPYLDGELTEGIRHKILEHLDACPPCGKAYDFENELKKVVGNRCIETVPEGLKERIAASLDAARGASGQPQA